MAELAKFPYGVMRSWLILYLARGSPRRAAVLILSLYSVLFSMSPSEFKWSTFLNFEGGLPYSILLRYSWFRVLSSILPSGSWMAVLGLLLEALRPFLAEYLSDVSVSPSSLAEDGLM